MNVKVLHKLLNISTAVSFIFPINAVSIVAPSISFLWSSKALEICEAYRV